MEVVGARAPAGVRSVAKAAEQSPREVREHRQRLRVDNLLLKLGGAPSCPLRNAPLQCLHSPDRSLL